MYPCTNFIFEHGFRLTCSSGLGVYTSVFTVWSLRLLSYLETIPADGPHWTAISEKRTLFADFGGTVLLFFKSYSILINFQLLPYFR